MNELFSKRMGINLSSTDIKIRYEAPLELRNYLLLLMEQYFGLKTIRKIVCLATKESPDPSNWNENEFMRSEIQTVIEICHWSRVYDIMELFYHNLDLNCQESFSQEINDYFTEKGIGWKLEKGKIVIRGEDALETVLKEVEIELGEKELNTSRNEIKEAVKDLSRRPEAEITGAIQHSIAALECVCREVCGGEKDTLGTLINKYPNIVPLPLNDVIKKIWGFSSEQGRHLREGREPYFEEAELMVYLSASLCTYLSKKHII